jgi:hypothetical protein
MQLRTTYTDICKNISRQRIGRHTDLSATNIDCQFRIGKIKSSLRAIDLYSACPNACKL